VEIQDVKYEEFVSLLFVIFYGRLEISNDTLLSILDVADQFQMKIVLDSIEKLLIESKKIKFTKKLLIANNYEFENLTNHCLQRLKKPRDFEVFWKSSEYEMFCDAMKKKLLDRHLDVLDLSESSH
ncbi:hypothetical protein PENTCL1PPCAC_7265, partial [Pristionchus entomophagus]